MDCPECGANGYSRKTKTPEWRCRKCSHEWEPSDLALEPDSRTNPRPSARRTRNIRTRPRPEPETITEEDSQMRLDCPKCGTACCETYMSIQDSMFPMFRKWECQNGGCGEISTVRVSKSEELARTAERHRYFEELEQELKLERAKKRAQENVKRSQLTAIRLAKEEKEREEARPQVEVDNRSPNERFITGAIGPLVLIAAIVGLVFLFTVCSETPRNCETNPGSCDDRNFGDPRLH